MRSLAESLPCLCCFLTLRCRPDGVVKCRFAEDAGRALLAQRHLALAAGQNPFGWPPPAGAEPCLVSVESPWP